MKCPVDNNELTMSERQGIEIDYCPECRGVWLDRGELDKIIERAAPPERVADTRREYSDSDSHGGKHGGGHGSSSGRRKSRESFLGELFG
jgi:hypothetical protein